MLLASGDLATECMTHLFNQIIAEYKVLEDWNTKNVIVNCIKNKGEATERGNYRGLKLLEHTMKASESVVTHKSERW